MEAYEDCCGKLPPKYRATEVTDVPELSSRLEHVPRESETLMVLYRCRFCGQQWEEHRVPAFHAETFVVVRSGEIPDLADPPSPLPESVVFRPYFTPPQSLPEHLALAGIVLGTIAGIVLAQYLPADKTVRVAVLAASMISAALLGALAGVVLNRFRN